MTGGWKSLIIRWFAVRDNCSGFRRAYDQRFQGNCNGRQKSGFRPRLRGRTSAEVVDGALVGGSATNHAEEPIPLAEPPAVTAAGITAAGIKDRQSSLESPDLYLNRELTWLRSISACWPKPKTAQSAAGAGQVPRDTDARTSTNSS